MRKLPICFIKFPVFLSHTPMVLSEDAENIVQKVVLKIEFLEKDRLGYWERAGYSNKADPWKEQRYSSDDKL